MDRRGFVTGAAAGVAVGAGATYLALSGGPAPTPEAPATPAAPAIVKRTKDLRMVTTWPKNFPGLGTAANRFAEIVNQMSDGALNITVYAGNELVPPFESFDAVAKGDADLYHGAAYYWQGKSKAFNFFAAVPFGLTGPEHTAWIVHGGGQALWDRVAGSFGIKPFLGGNTGVQMGGWFNKEINSLEDYQGLKIRMPGLGGEVLRRIGANAISMPGGEIFPSLQSGAIDATEWVGPWNDLAFGFYKVTQYYYYPGFHEPGTALDIGINLGLWESLTDAERAIVSAASQAANDYSYAEFTANNGDALTELIDTHNVQLRRFPDTVLKAIHDAAAAVVREVAEEDADPLTKEVYDSFEAFKTKSIAWQRIAEHGYMDTRHRLRGA